MHPSGRRHRERAFLLRQRWPSPLGDLAGMAGGCLCSPFLRVCFRWPQSPIRSLWRSDMDAPFPCPCDRRRIIGMDRLHPSMAQALVAGLAFNSHGQRGHYRRVTHRSVHGLVNFPCHPGFGSSFLRDPLRFGTERNPLLDLLGLSRSKGRATVGFHSGPWYGSEAFC